MTYDALVVLSFGGPEGPDDVVPFLQNVTRGRPVPPERLASVAEHYEHFGGVSPINAENRALIAAIRGEFDRHDISLPIYWGNRNWDPYIADAVRTMAEDGIGRALVLVTSAYSSYSSCRQYRDDLAAARETVGDGAPVLDKLRHFFDHPGFIDPQVDAVSEALDRIVGSRHATTRLVFTAHSIPVAMADQAGPEGNLYVRQLLAAADLIVRGAGTEVEWDLVFQSRSGTPSVPWLEPDVEDHLRALAAQGVTDVVVVPVGFVSDHVEVQWDLDVQAADVAAELGLGFTRTSTSGSDPRFAAMVRELVVERLDPSVPVQAPSGLPITGADCPMGCCRPSRTHGSD